MKRVPIVILIALTMLGISCKESTKQMEGDVVVEKSVDSRSDKKHVLNKNAVTFKDKSVLPKVFDAYQMITEDLVNSDLKSVKKHEADLLQAVGKSDEEKWNRIKEIVETLTTINDLETYRVGYFDLTRELEMPFKEEIASGEIYMQYCPMAFNNKGAYWFSSDKEIMNPYFGDEMLHCGGIKETFK